MNLRENPVVDSRCARRWPVGPNRSRSPCGNPPLLDESFIESTAMVKEEPRSFDEITDPLGRHVAARMTAAPHSDLINCSRRIYWRGSGERDASHEATDRATPYLPIYWWMPDWDLHY